MEVSFGIFQLQAALESTLVPCGFFYVGFIHSDNALNY